MMFLGEGRGLPNFNQRRYLLGRYSCDVRALLMFLLYFIAGL